MRYKINYLKVFFFIIFFSFNYIKNLNAEISNNIVVMVGDEMITSYDLEQEKLYLSLINQININSLNKKQLDDMAKDSLIREKVKLNVINKQKNLVIDDDFISININQVPFLLSSDQQTEQLNETSFFSRASAARSGRYIYHRTCSSEPGCECGRPFPASRSSSQARNFCR